MVLVLYARCVLLCRTVFFFFKQKTAYEMRIIDWSSDVCSSDLSDPKNLPYRDTVKNMLWHGYSGELGYSSAAALNDYIVNNMVAQAASGSKSPKEIGRASCRERVCQYV